MATRCALVAEPGTGEVKQIGQGGAGAHDPANRVEDSPQIMLALRGILAHQGEVGRHEAPFLIGHISRIRFAGSGVHPSDGAAHRSQVHTSL